MQNYNEYELLEIIDSSSVGSFICDMEKGEIYYSYEWSKRLGIEHLSPREATRVATTHVHPEDRDSIQRAFLQACEQKSAKVKMEFRAKTVDSGYIWILGQGKIIYNQDGKPIKYYGTYSDITEQKKAEEELQRYAEELKQKEDEALELIDGGTEGSWIVDRLTNTIKCSEKWAKRIGLDLVPEEERLAYTHKLTHPDDTAGENSIQHYMEIGAKRFNLEYRIKTIDSGYIWTQNKGKIVYNVHGEALKVYATTIDITMRKKMEEGLRKSEERYHGLFDSMSEAFELMELIYENEKPVDYIFLDVNPAWERMTGLKREQVLGRKASEAVGSVESYWPESLDRALRTGEMVNIENYGVALDKWYSVNIWKYSETSCGVTITDITERKKAEDALKESERIALDSVEKLRIADKNKNNFINMLSHELRNPLASIIMSLELLEKVPYGGKQASMALDIAKRQGKQLTNLVDDLLDVTRINQNKVSLKKEILEINNLIDKAVQDYRSQFIDKNVKLKVNLTVPLYIEADYSRLTQVIGNLLHNAAKFTNKNDLVMVSVIKDINTSEAVITVQDTGRGIDQKDQINLFEPFIQVDKSLDRRLGGLGLGLSIVKGMVELHGGKVEAFSEGIGKGSKFTIRLPLL